MSEQIQRQFHTEGPADLYVEIGSGTLAVVATETDQTTVQVTGRGAEMVTVEQSGNQISVIGPKNRGFLGFDRALDVQVTLPADSEVGTKVGSAEIDIAGRISGCRLRSGSGNIRLEEVTGTAEVMVGSGDVTVTGQAGDLNAKSGSGEVEARTLTGRAQVITGSGDIRIGDAQGANIKTGSGDCEFGTVRGNVVVTTASGDLAIGRIPHGEVRAKAASGNVRIGIPQGTPVWTDINTITGRARAEIESAGQPQEGQDHVIVRATTVSGDVTLRPA